MIKKIIINEIFNHLLDETYKSVSEIKELASDVIRKIAEENLDLINKQKKLIYLYGMFLKSIDSSKYEELKDFIENTHIVISINNKRPKDPRGQYTVFTHDKYNPRLEREINVYVDLEKISNRIDEEFKEKDELRTQDLYMILFYEMYSTLIHELQHAYDDYRSKGKAFKTKEFDKYRKKYMQDKIDDVVEYDIERFTKYVNLPHEIWARFSQAMRETYFADLDDDETGSYYFVMIPLKDVVKSFKYKFDYYERLPEKMKKKLINKVVQFWHYEKEKINKKNEEKKNRKANRTRN